MRDWKRDAVQYKLDTLYAQVRNAEADLECGYSLKMIDGYFDSLITLALQGKELIKEEKKAREYVRGCER